jgi:Rps23 Pro-64 3,4-dihydroxylase Tpa1-like proline 4-hydroxylase
MINPDLNIKDLAKEFKQTKVVRINNFLTKEVAEDYHQFLSKEMPRDWWYLSTYPKRPGINSKTDNTRLFNNADINAEIAYKKAISNEHFQLGNFSYSFKRTIDNHVDGCKCKECYLKNYLNSPSAISFINKITNYKVENTTSLFSSLYEEGDFLSIHHDGPNGKIGFVYNLCLNWKPDWGGLLHTLTNDKKQVLKTYVPGFNTLTMFDSSSETGYPHYVSHVVSKSAKRFSFTGWYK